MLVERIYLDNQATRPMDSAAMLRYFSEVNLTFDFILLDDASIDNDTVVLL